LLDSHGEVLGTFACYLRHPATPTAHHRWLIKSATQTAAVCIIKAQSERSLLESERTLRQSNELLGRMERLAQIGAWSLDAETGELTWSREVYRIHDVDPNTRPVVDNAINFYAPSARPNIRAAVEAGLRDGIPWDLELPFITATGRHLWVRAQGQAEFADGRLKRIHGAFQDITERKQAVAALRESEERLQLALRGTTDGLWDWKLKTNDAYLSPRWKAMLGYADDELPNHLDTWKQLTHPDDVEPIMAVATDVAAGRADKYDVEFRMRHKDGRWLSILSRAFLVRDSSGQPERLVGTHLDLTERKLVERRLADSENRFRKLVEDTNVIVWEYVPATECLTYVSPQAAQLGYPIEDWYRPHFWRDHIHPDDRTGALEFCDAQIKAGTDHQFHYRFARANGEYVWFDDKVSLVPQPDGSLVLRGVFIDITERKNAESAQAALEAQLRQSQKMEAVGTLAGGIAHDFNNILGVIMGCGEIARRESKTNLEAVQALDDLLVASRRARELIRQILTFSRRDVPQRSVVRLDAIVRESIRMLRATVPATIELREHISTPLPPVLADATLMTQVILNLATNAARAIGSNPGCIEIQLVSRMFNETQAAALAGLKAGPYAHLTVRDNGPGMDAKIRDRIFEPFFTTKAPGQGTGLGLSVVHGVVKSHDGVITVDSQPGVGTRFDIFLPTTPEVEPIAAPPARPGIATATRERILLVDDEPSLLKVCGIVLKQAGYTVTACASPLEAFEHFRRTPEEFDLLVTDYSMPNQTGIDLGCNILALRPGFRMIICTGYGAGLTREKAIGAGFSDVLQKPVEPDHLCNAVRDALLQPIGSRHP
jgi:PAS domain S-box-containing protein